MPGAGWIGLDPTSGLLAGEGHIPLAATPSPRAPRRSPARTARREVEFSFSMQVERMRETPRVGQPYTEEQWQAILAAGDAVDARLAGRRRAPQHGRRADLRGPRRRRGAGVEHRRAGPDQARLRREARRAACARASPRAACCTTARASGIRARRRRAGPSPSTGAATASRCGSDPSLIAEERRGTAGTSPTRRGLPARWAARWACPPTAPSPPTRTPPTSCWRSGSCRSASRRADNASPIRPSASASCAPSRAASAQPVGYVLPLLVAQTRDGRRRFMHGALGVPARAPVPDPGRFARRAAPAAGGPARDRRSWTTRTCCLPTPSPIPRSCRAHAMRGGHAPCPHAEPRPAQKAHRCARRSRSSPRRACVRFPAAAGATARTMPRWSPPSRTTAAATAASRSAWRAIRLRSTPASDASGSRPTPASSRSTCTRRRPGRRPSPSPRPSTRRRPPSASGRRSSGSTAAISAPAAAITSSIGGMTPADSPFLRRPDLLASVVAFWQNHPSLTYLFAGQFVGPTSQAPRVDEARHESLYELEIALAQIPEPGGAGPALAGRPPVPQPAGRCHRQHPPHGDLHRQALRARGANGAAGPRRVPRLRDAAARAHGVAQQLLIRALVARFWERPYRQRAGALGHRAARPLHAAALPVGRLRGRHRRPARRRLAARGAVVRAALRVSLPGAGGDRARRRRRSSCARRWSRGSCWASRAAPAAPPAPSIPRSTGCRCCATASGGDRYAVSCNGYLVPLRPTGVAGERVAGVRFSAWRTADGLHPTIPPHGPLTFDIIDTWSGRSVGGCRYHVAHARRPQLRRRCPSMRARPRPGAAALFEPIGHSPEGTPIEAAGVHPEFPLTLDLAAGGAEQSLVVGGPTRACQQANVLDCAL